MTEAPLIVIVADANTGAGTLAVLRDWAAAGLIERFLWVPAFAPEPSAGQHPTHQSGAILCGSDGALATEVAEHLSERGSITRARICALDLLDGPAIAEMAKGVAKQIERSSPKADIVRVHAVPIVAAWTRTRALVPILGWHIVALSPEEAYSPDSARHSVSGDNPPTVIAMHIAARLAGVLGMWSGVPECTLDSTPPPEAQAVLARSYFSRWDADGFDEELDRRLTDFGGQLPAPVQDGHALPSIDDERGASLAAANALLDAHAGRLRSERRPLPRREQEGVGWRQAFSMLWSFIWAALKNAPRDWLNRTIARASTGLASSSQNLTFGDGSDYQVVVRGRLPDGRLASWGQVDDALARVGRTLEPVGHHEAADNLAPFWREFVGVGLSLADGRARASQVAPPSVGGAVGVVRTTRTIAPAPGLAFSEIPPQVSGELGVSSIPPSDVTTSRAVRDELDAESRRSAFALELGRARDDLDEWRKTVQLPSYSGRVGEQLDKRITDLRQETATLVDQLRQATSRDGGDDRLVRIQERLARRMRWTIVGSIMLVIGLALVGYAEWIDRSLMTALLVLTPVLSVMVLFLMFALGQRALFQEMSRRRAESSLHEVRTANLAAAIADLRRLTRAYRQFLCWATILGAFLERPLGPTPTRGPQSPPLVGALPRSVGIGWAPDATDLSRLAAESLSRRLFTVGWLSDPWGSLLRDTDRYCPNQWYEVRGNPDILFEDPARANGPLQELASSLARTGVTADSAGRLQPERLWSLDPGTLARIRDQLRERTSWTDGRSAPVSRLPGDSASSDWPPFDASALRPEARSRGSLEVRPDGSRLVESSSGLSQTSSLVQLSRPFPCQELSAAEPLGTTQDQAFGQGDDDESPKPYV